MVENPPIADYCRILNLADCRGLGAESLKAILCGSKNLGQLQGLTLDGIAEVDDQLLAEICLGLPELARLSLKFCSLVTDAGKAVSTARPVCASCIVYLAFKLDCAVSV